MSNLTLGLLTWLFALLQSISPIQNQTEQISSGGNLLGGGTRASFSTDAQGAATYTIPIQVPPGTGGMQPQLSLNYSSQGGNGILGQGFSISGIPSITREGATIARDGFSGAVNYDANDRFEIEGNRIINIDSEEGGYTGDSTEFRSEIDSWNRIIASGDSCGNGPCSFTVTLKNGTVLAFGTASNSRIEAVGDSFKDGGLEGSVRTWLLSSVTDLNGNSMNYTYSDVAVETDGDTISETVGMGEYYPLSISYTLNSNLPATRLVQFFYASRPDAITQFAGGASVTTAARLTDIQTALIDYSGDTTLVKEYVLAYDSSSMLGFSRLASIQEKTGTGDYLPPITMKWSEGPNGFSTDTVSWGEIFNNSGWVGDFNGDGRTDLLTNTAGDSLWFANSAGFIQGEISTDVEFQSMTFIADFTGDGLADLFTVGSVEGALYPATGDGFSGDSIQVSGLTVGTDCDENGCAVAADFNGDGKSDFFSLTGSLGQLSLANGNGFDTVIQIPDFFLDDPAKIYADFNGDGLVDILNFGTDEGTLYFSNWSDSTGFKEPLDISISGLNMNCSDCYYIGEFNGDGMTDIFFQLGSGYAIAYATGKGFTEPDSLSGIDLSEAETVFFEDFNGDGLMDFYALYQGPETLFYNNGFDFQEFTLPEQLALAADSNCWIGDFNGDGMTDIFSASSTAITCYAADTNGLKTSNQLPNLLTSIENGMGGTTSITYKPITDTTVYTKGLLGDSLGTESMYLYHNFSPTPLSGVQAPTYPVEIVQNAMYVTSGYKREDGRGDDYGITFTYTAAVTDPTRGFLGFGQKARSDTSTNTWSVTNYHQLFPFTGKTGTKQLYQLSDTSLLHQFTYQYLSNPTIHGDSTIFQVLTGMKMADHYTYGTYDFTLMRSYEYDTYGNAVLTIEFGETNLPYSVYTFAEFTNDTANWHLGYQTQQWMSSDISGSDTLSLSITEYDSSTMNILLRNSWNDQQNIWLPTTYGYDDFGNTIFTVSTSGDTTFSMFDSTSYFTYASQTIFPPNAKGYRRTDSLFVYDMAFGKRIQQSDANGTTVYTHLDGLGRTQSLTGPDLSGDTVTLLKNAHIATADSGYLVRSQVRLDWDGTQWQSMETWYDGLGRNYQSLSYDQDSTVIQIIDLVNDSKGRVIRQSVPYYDGDSVYWQEKTYDPYGRVVRVVHPKGNSDSSVTELTFKGSTVSILKAAGTADSIRTVRNYAWLNGKSQIVYQVQNSTDTTFFNYDLLGRKTGFIDPTGIGRRKTYTSTNRSATSQDSSLGLTQFEFFDSLKYALRTDATGGVITYKFDAMNRIILKQLGPSDSIEYIYDDSTCQNCLGRLSYVNIVYGDSLTCQKAYSYDAYGNLQSETNSILGTSYTRSYTYLPNRQLDTRTFPDSSTVEYAYTWNGFLDSLNLKEDDSVKNYAQYGNYTPSGNPQFVMFGNGVTASYAYDPLGNLTTTYIWDKQGQSLMHLSYHWDYQFRITEIEDLDSAAATQKYYFDPIGRLDSAYSNYGPLNYDYDAAGNLLQKDGIDYIYHNYQVLAGVENGDTVWSAAYDSLGNRIQMVQGTDTTQYAYDIRNQLTSVVRNDTILYEYVYDEQGNRILKIDPVNAFTTIYIDPSLEVTQFGEDSTYTTRYLLTSLGNVAAITTKSSGTSTSVAASEPISGVPQPGVLFFHQNHIGSTSLTSDSLGSLASKIVNKPFGSTWQITGPDNFRAKFGGKERDASSALLYFNARYYDPLVGRFITSDDRLGGHSRARDVLNTYAFTLNNPTLHIDPTGHKIQSYELSLIFSGVGAIAFTGLAVFSGGLTALLSGSIAPLSETAAATLIKAVGTAFAGAGIGGASYAGTNTNGTFQWKDWGSRTGFGAAVGLILGSGASWFASGSASASAVGDGVAESSSAQLAAPAESEVSNASEPVENDGSGSNNSSSSSNSSVSSSSSSSVRSSASSSVSSSSVSASSSSSLPDIAPDTEVENSAASQAPSESANQSSGNSSQSQTNSNVQRLPSSPKVDAPGSSLRKTW